MDLNYLYFRHGVERLRAAAAACAPSRVAHLDLADRYGVLIGRQRDDNHARQPMREADQG